MGRNGSTPDAERGDEELRGFIDANHGRLIGLLRFRGHQAAEAEDLAQEAMVRLVERWDEVRTLADPWAWVVRVALNLATSRWRRLQTALRRRHLIASDDVHYDSTAVEALALLDGLSPRQRLAVVLRYYAGLSVRDTAELMGVAEGTVKSLCAKGLEAADRRSWPPTGTTAAPTTSTDSTDPVEAS